MRKLRSLFGGFRWSSSRGALPRDLAVLKADQTARPGGAVYKKGDFIGKSYEVFGVLGVGGFGVVYLVYSQETGTAYALKTLRDTFLEDPQTKELFRKEAKVWVGLGRHPYIVSAYFVEELAGRLYIGMEYVAPNEKGINSLEGYLAGKHITLLQSLQWAIQCCHGMEFANSRGIRSHRDIKPANIMITEAGVVKISDFGFADVIDLSRVRSLETGVRRKRFVQDNQGFGTPSYMAPEQFMNASRCDARSDIYSLGIVMYQMAARGRLPFQVRLRRFSSRRRPPNIWRDMHQLHAQGKLPRLDSPLFPIIERCLQKEQSARYQTFRDLRHDLELLLRQHGGEVEVPKHAREVQAWELYNAAFSLARLGQLEEAIQHYDKVLALEPKNTDAWNNRGVCCKKLGRLEDALICYENAILSERHNASAWGNKGNVLYALGRFPEAIVSLNKAIEIDEDNESAWLNKAITEERLGLHGEAAVSFKRFIDLKPVEYAAHLDFARGRLAALREKKGR